VAEEGVVGHPPKGETIAKPMGCRFRDHWVLSNDKTAREKCAGREKQ
jgi:hypothetical protein